MVECNRRKVIISLVSVGVVALLLLVILLPMSFVGIEYHEFGFKRQKSTGFVDTTVVYTGGKYFVGPDWEFKIFKADAHFMNLDNIDVFTQDKLEVILTVHMQYFLRKDELPVLHDTFDTQYQEVMRSSAMDTLKGAIPVFTTRELFLNRTQVERDLYMAIRQRIGGTCCRPDCKEYADACPVGCVPRSKCTDKEKGLNADVKYFQLTGIVITDEVKDRYMEALVLDEKFLREELYQNATIVRKKTTELMQNIKNTALEIRQNANSQAELIATIAEANYTTIIEKARSTGLLALYNNLSITEQNMKNSFDYLRTLRHLDNIHLTVDFQQRIAGNL